MSETVTATFVFTDLVDSTALGSRLGPDKAEEVRGIHFGLLRGVIEAASGTEVKNLGDGLMVMFTSTNRAVACAAGMQQAIDRHNRRAEVPLSIRIGVGVGEATEDDGDYFGDPVIEAARLCALAAGGQVLATQTVAVLAGRSTSQVLRPVGDLELKGIPEPVPCVEVVWEPEDPGDDATPMPRRLTAVLAQATLGFAGRKVEADTIRAAAKASQTDRSVHLVAIAGEPGMGKTTLAAKVAKELHDNGDTVLLGRNDEGITAPFRPWIEAVSHLLEHLPAGLEVAEVVEPDGPLARWVPGLTGGSVDARPVDAGETDEARFELFEAVSDLLVKVSAERPVVLILDDLQWADAASLQLLRHLLTSAVPAPVLLIGTYRDSDLSRGDRLSGFLADMHREVNVTRIDLAGLDDAEVVRLMEGAAGHELTEAGIELAHALYRETKGNPFFTGEMLRHLATTGAIAQGASGRFELQSSIAEMGLPSSVRDVVARRVDRLGEESVAVLQVAAGIGLTFDVDLLLELVDQSEDAVLDVLDEAMIASLIAEDRDVVGRFAFIHGLVQQTLYQDQSATRRRRLHLRIAETLEGRAGEVDPALLATHFLAATRPADATKAVRYAIAAGEAAAAALAFEDATDWYTQALELLPDGTDDALRCDVLAGLGKARLDAGDPAFRATLLEAADLAERLGDHRQLIAVARNLTGDYARFDSEDPERLAVARRALEVAGDDDPHVQVHLLAALATATDVAKVTERRDLAERAVDIARASGNEALLLEALVTGHSANAGPAMHDQWMTDLEWAIARFDGLGPRYQSPHLLYANQLAVEGRVDEAEAMVALTKELLGTKPSAAKAGYVRQHEVALLLHRGHTGAAEELAATEYAEASAAGFPGALRNYASHLFVIRELQDRLDEIVDLFVDATRSAPGVSTMQAATGFMLCYLGRYDEAREACPLTRETIEEFPEDIAWLTGMKCLAFTAFHLDDLDAAALLYETILPYRGYFACSYNTLTGSLEQSLGLLAMTLGRVDDAVDHLRAGVQRNTDAGSMFWSAETRLDLAEALARRGDPGDAEERTACIAEAVSTATEYGFPGLLNRAEEARHPIAG